MEISFFWQNVKTLLKANNLTQKKLADICNISFGTLQGWIAKSVIPDVFSSVKIARVLGVTVEFLVTGTEPEITKQDVINYLQNNLK